MNYDHAFHAGNFADVVKHIALTRVIDYLKRKPTPFRVIDTHAGSGRYILDDGPGTRNPEWRQGIARLLAAKLDAEAAALVAPYLDVVRRLATADGTAAYPGSPLIARALLRPEDRLTAMELHPGAARRLRALFAGDTAVKVMAVDGYPALPAQLPPKQKRALVLIDPPFESDDEFARMVAALKAAHRIFPGAIYVLWYPLKNDRAVADFKAALRDSLIPDIVYAEFRLRAPSEPPRLYGSGLVFVNAPYVLRNELDLIHAALLPVLADSRTARHETGILRPERSAGRG